MESGYLLIFRRCLVFSFPVFHSISDLFLAIALIDRFLADLILVTGGMMFEVVAAFAAWSAHSLPSMFLCPDTHSIWMVLEGLISWILSIVSSISLMIH